MQRYQNIIANANTGLPVNGAQVYVLNYGTSTESTIYSDDGISPVAQPLQTDSLGSFYFYAANGHYTVNIYYNAVLVGSLPDILLQDAADPLTVDITGGTINATTIGATTPSSGAFTTAAISGGTIDSAVIGGTTPAAGTFTSVTGTSVSASSYNGGSLGGRRNLIINGNFQVNQRAVSGTVTLSAGVYGHDRWKGGASGGTYTFSTSGTDTTLSISAGTMQQVIAGENVSGTTYVLSWTGTAQARFNGGTYGASPLAITGITAGANLTIEFGTGSVGLVQVEQGTVATTFERALFSDEYARCLRYFEKSFPYGTAPAQNAGTTGSVQGYQISGASSPAKVPYLRFTVRKASTTPTITTYNPSAANAQIRNLTGSTDWSGTFVAASSDDGISIAGTTAAASTTTSTFAFHWTAEAEL